MGEMPHEIASDLATELRLPQPDPATIQDLTEQLEDLVGREFATELVRRALADQGLK